MIRTIAVIAAVLAAVLAGPCVLAQDAASPLFFIEKIEVRNTARVSPDVVIAESRLREGAEYSESELRDAAARLARLPFLLTAEFALERGTERGRHILVITVTETRSFFFRLDIVPIVEQNPNAGVNIRTETPSGDSTAAALGYRWFLGRRGALHVALIGRNSTELTRGYSAFAVGWTQYDLFGTRAFATLNIKDSPELGTSPQIVVGVPLSLNQTITAEYDEVIVDYEYKNVARVNDRDTQRVARLTWSYNTANHPYLPTEGILFSAGPIANWRDEGTLFRVFSPEEGQATVVEVPVHSRVIGVEASAQRFWEITDRTSVSVGVESRLGHFEQRLTFQGRRSVDRYNSVSGIALFGVSRSLWSPERRALGGDSRLEFNLRGRVRDNDVNEPERVFRIDDDVVQASVSWVRHSSWGTIRLGAGVAW